MPLTCLSLIGTAIDVSLRLKGKDENLRGVTPENKVEFSICFAIVNPPTPLQASVLAFYTTSVFMSKAPVSPHQAVSLGPFYRIGADLRS